MEERDYFKKLKSFERYCRRTNVSFMAEDIASEMLIQWIEKGGPQGVKLRTQFLFFSARQATRACKRFGEQSTVAGKDGELDIFEAHISDHPTPLDTLEKKKDEQKIEKVSKNCDINKRNMHVLKAFAELGKYREMLARA